MKNRTVNMFAATSEDLPLFSGFELTQAAEMPVEWNNEKLNGYCPATERSIFIRPTFFGEFQVEVSVMDYFTNNYKIILLEWVGTREEAEALALSVATSK